MEKLLEQILKEIKNVKMEMPSYSQMALMDGIKTVYDQLVKVNRNLEKLMSDK